MMTKGLEGWKGSEKIYIPPSRPASLWQSKGSCSWTETGGLCCWLRVYGTNPHFIPQLYLLLSWVLFFFFHDLSSPQVPFTVLQKQIILSSNEKQPPLGTKPTAVLWPQGNVMHWLGTDIKSADWIDWAQAVKPLYFIGRPSITTAQQTSLVHCTYLLREATLSPLKFY